MQSLHEAPHSSHDCVGMLGASIQRASNIYVEAEAETMPSNRG